MSTLTLSDTSESFAELVEWLESPRPVSRPVGRTYPRVEDFIKNGNYLLRVENGNYVVRAELPGLDPEKDIDVTLSRGVLTVRAGRHDKTEGTHRSRFRYGASVHSIALPADADEKQIQAVYGNGVLEVTVGLKDNGDGKSRRRIPIVLRNQQ